MSRKAIKCIIALVLVLTAMIAVRVPFHHGRVVRETKIVEMNSELSEVVLDTDRKYLNGIAVKASKPIDVFVRVTDANGNELVSKNITAEQLHIGYYNEPVWYQVYFPKEVYYTPECHVLVTSASAARVKIAPVHAVKVISPTMKIVIVLLTLYFLCLMLPLEKVFGKPRVVLRGLLFLVLVVLLVHAFKVNDTFDYAQSTETMIGQSLKAADNGEKIPGGYGLANYWGEGKIRDEDIYTSQYGLQGRATVFFLHFLPYRFILPVLRVLSKTLMAIVVIMMSYFIRKKYNTLFAACFYLTFLFSPWAAYFAVRLYWAEYTWFLPMLVGLIASIYIEDNNSAACRVPRAACRVPHRVLYCIVCNNID